MQRLKKDFLARDFEEQKIIRFSNDSNICPSCTVICRENQKKSKDDWERFCKEMGQDPDKGYILLDFDFDA